MWAHDPDKHQVEEDEHLVEEDEVEWVQVAVLLLWLRHTVNVQTRHYQ